MKINKDALLKQHFWILVVLTLPLALVAILLLVTSVSSAISNARKKLTGELATVTGAKDIKTPEEIAKLKAEADILVGHETTAWSRAFIEQAPQLHWPRLVEAKYEISTGRFANDVEILKQPADKAAWPADVKIENVKDEEKAEKAKVGVMHGLLQNATDDVVVISDRTGQSQTFHVTPHLTGRDVANKEDEKAAGFKFAELNQYRQKFVVVTYQQGRYFNERLTDNERIDYMKTYHSQVPSIIRQVEPLYFRTSADGKVSVHGVVQFAGGWTLDPAQDRYDEIPEKKKADLLPPTGAQYLRFKHDKWDIAADFSQEAWIAQEDLWIQNEIYRLVRVANDSVAQFQKVPDAKEVKGKARFKNPYLEITLALRDGNKLEVRIANLLHRRQKLDGLNLRMWLAGPNADPEVHAVSGDPLEARATPGKDTRDLVLNLKGKARAGIFGLEQVLTWESAAVKRIDHIAIGSEANGDISFSQRTMPLGLRPYIQLVAKGDDADKAAPVPGMPGVPPGMDMKKGMPIPGMPNPGGGQGGGRAALPNGFVAERYQEVTPQFRRVPVAVALIVDQNHVDRVQTAFNASKLRFLATQVLLNHYPQSLRPAGVNDKNAEKPGGIAPPVGGFFPAMPNMPGMPQIDRNKQAPEVSGDLEANMELVLYGVVTLYERYPPRPAPPVETRAP